VQVSEAFAKFNLHDEICLAALSLFVVSSVVVLVVAVVAVGSSLARFL